MFSVAHNVTPEYSSAQRDDSGHRDATKIAGHLRFHGDGQVPGSGGPITSIPAKASNVTSQDEGHRSPGS
jgi:hypothetical protein